MSSANTISSIRTRPGSVSRRNQLPGELGRGASAEDAAGCGEAAEFGAPEDGSEEADAPDAAADGAGAAGGAVFGVGGGAGVAACGLAAAAPVPGVGPASPSVVVGEDGGFSAAALLAFAPLSAPVSPAFLGCAAEGGTSKV